jgi:hypothetical protein
MRCTSFFMHCGAAASTGAAGGSMPNTFSTAHSAAWKSMPLQACSSLKPPPGPHLRQW